MRPANLIPKEQRRGAGRGAAGTRSGVAVYVLLGVLAAAVLGVVALVLTSNKINDREGELAALEQKEQAAKAAAEALRPYGDFVKLASNRQQTVSALATSRFNWERVLRQLSRTIPSNAWLTDFNGTVSSEAKSSESGGSGLRGEISGPAVELTGCTYSQSDVARMMVRMRNIDGVTQVILEESGSDEQGQESSSVSAAAGGGSSTGCGPRALEFKIVMAFGGVALPGSSGAAPTGAAQQIAKAQAAAAKADGAGNAGSGQ